MQVNWEIRENTMHIYLTGELDHHAARTVLEQAGQAVDGNLPMRCVLNLSGLAFMDSSGIAVVLGIHRRLKAYGGELKISGIPAQAMRVLHTAGVDRLVSII
ncbi:MAG: STAS domain-containing protein [Oscillospiraceae bacterium]|nr:STAS domain-containing protein [Oscillospiraceae bacterium]